MALRRTLCHGRLGAERSFIWQTHCKSFHSSGPTLLPRRQTRRPELPEIMSTEEAFAALGREYKGDDTTSLGHHVLRQKRKLLYYLRLIEHEMPKLVAFRKPFIPPTSATPLIVRSIDYAGEEHPATVKRCIVVPVAQLSLNNRDAIHKIKLLAGPRWTPNPPSDSGVGPNELGSPDGYIKISCEDFPKPAMNLKWASDALDRLIAEANNPDNDIFKDIPLDSRHVHAKARKAKRGEHIRNRVGHRPTLEDFPKEWLPMPSATPGPISPE